MRLVRATLGVRKGIEKKLHNYGGPAKVMHVWFVRRHTENSFCHCSGPVKLVQASLCVRKDIESIFYHCSVPYLPQFECLEGSQGQCLLLWRYCEAVA